MPRPRRQAIRRTILLLVLLAFPVTLNYYSPYLIVASASEGVVSFPLVLWASWTLTALVLGRVACAYICPLGAIQMAKDRIAARPLTRVRGLGIVRYVLAAAWVGAIAAATVSSGGYHRVNLLYNTESGVSVESPQSLITYYMVISIPLIAAMLLGKRGFCRYLCPFGVLNMVGSWLGRRVGLPSLRLVADPGRCRQCQSCDAACPMSLTVSGMVAHGTIGGSECMLCGSCLDGCPEGVIRYAWAPAPRTPSAAQVDRRQSGGCARY